MVAVLEMAKAVFNRSLIHRIQAAVVVHDADTKVIVCNSKAQELLGLTEEQMLGKAAMNPDWKFLGADGERLSLEKYPVNQAVFTQQPLRDFTIGIFRPNKSDVVWVLVNADPVLDDKGKIQQVIVTFMDITDLKQAEEALRESEEKLVRAEKLAILGKLAGVLGHEIKAPLGVIKHSLEFLKVRLDQDVDAKIGEHLNLMHAKLNTMDKTIDDVLDFARTKKLELMTVDPGNLVEYLLRDIPIPANIRIVPDLGRNLPCIAVDERQIQQVFRNIIANAIDAMIDGGTLTVSTGKQLSDNAGHEFVTISFRDTGEGISPDHVKKIFEPLFSTKVKGTGLGLVACENVIHAHGGSIEVSSELGKGSTFIVKFPIKEN
jgi:PAS domain S-box-containing protein